MAIQFADNFDNYGETETFLLDGIYASYDGTLLDDPDPSATGKAMYFNDAGGGSPPTGYTNNRHIRKTYNAPLTTAGVQWRLWPTELPDNNSCTMGLIFANVNNEAQVALRLLTTGAIVVTRGNYAGTAQTPAGTVIGTTGPVITAGAWNHIEAKVFLNNSTGTVQIYVNGVSVLNLTGQDTIADETTATIDQVTVTGGYGGFNGDSRSYIKDLILWDTTGSSNNDFLGTVSVYTLRPDADDSLNWTPSSGSTGWDLIDDSTPDDAGYISAGDPPPSPAVFTLTNLPVDIVGVKALLPFVRARKIDGGDGNIQTGLTGTLTDLGADRPITSAFTYWWDVSELSPDTSAAWTPLEVDAVKLQIDRTT